MLRFNHLQSIWDGRKVLRGSTYYQSGGPQINHDVNELWEAKEYPERRVTTLATILSMWLVLVQVRGGEVPRQNHLIFDALAMLYIFIHYPMSVRWDYADIELLKLH